MTGPSLSVVLTGTDPAALELSLRTLALQRRPPDELIVIGPDAERLAGIAGTEFAAIFAAVRARPGRPDDDAILAAIADATGDYLHVHPAGGWLMPDAYRTSLALAAQAPATALILHHPAWQDGSDPLGAEPLGVSDQEIIAGGAELVAAMPYGTLRLLPPEAALARRSVLVDSGWDRLSVPGWRLWFGYWTAAFRQGLVYWPQRLSSWPELTPPAVPADLDWPQRRRFLVDLLQAIGDATDAQALAAFFGSGALAVLGFDFLRLSHDDHRYLPLLSPATARRICLQPGAIRP